MIRYFHLVFLLQIAATATAQIDQPLTNNTKSQEILFHSETTHHYTFSFINENIPDKENTNAIIRSISTALSQTSPAGFAYTMNYNILLSIRKKGSVLEVNAGISSEGITGRSTMVEGFPMDGVLYPDRMNFKLQLLHNNNNPFYEEAFYSVSTAEMTQSGKYCTLASFTIPDTISSSDLAMKLLPLEGTNKRLLFYHSLSALQQVNNRLATIDGYKEDASWLKRIINEIKQFDLNNLDMLHQYRDDLSTMKQGVDEIIDNNYTGSLQLKKNDPLRLLDKLNEFASLYKNISEELGNMLKTLDTRYFNKGLAFYQRGDKQTALSFFNQALTINNAHYPSHYYIAYIDFDNGLYRESRKRINNMLASMQPSYEYQNKGEALLDAIQEAIASEKYKEYTDLLQRAETEWRAGRLETAIYYINKATDFQFEHGVYILTNDDAQKLFDQILNDMTSDAERDIAAGNYQRAVQKYQDIISFCEQNAKKLTNFVALESRLNDIHYLYFNRIITRGNELLINGDLPAVEEKIDEAIAYLSAHSGINNQKHLDNLIAGFCEEVLMSGIQLTNRKMYHEAVKVLNHALYVSEKYKYPLTSDVSRYLNEAWSGVLANILFIGQQAINAGDYLLAEQQLKEAIALTHDHPGVMNMAALDIYKERLLNAYLTEGKKQLKNKQYEDAVNLFSYGQSIVYEYGIRHTESITNLIQQAYTGQCNQLLEPVLTKINNGNLSTALDDLEEANNYLVSHKLTGTSFNDVAKELYNAFSHRIDLLNRQKNYHDAINDIASLRKLCNTFYSRCEKNQIDIREKTSRYGIYLQLVTQSYEAIHTGDLNSAKRYASEAMTYQSLYPQYIPNNEEAETALNRILIAEYQNNINQGKSLLERKDYVSALPFYNRAINIAKQGSLEVSNADLQDRKTAAKGIVLQMCDELKSSIDEQQLMTSKDQLLKIIQMIGKYGLQHDQDITLQVSSLEDTLLGEECRLVRDRYNELMQQATENAKNRSFLKARDKIEEAIAVVAASPDCRLADSGATKYLKQLTPAIQYQQMLKETHDYLEAYKSLDALNTYLALEKYYSQYNVSIYGLDHQPFFNFALEQHNNFVLQTAYYYANQPAPDKAYRMLQELQLRGYPRNQSRNIQEKIARLLAERDFQSSPESRWKDLVKLYTKRDKFFRYFKKAYKKQWKSLQ